MGEASKVVKSDTGILVGGCGETAFCHALREWARKDTTAEIPRPREIDGVGTGSGLIAYPDGRVEMVDSSGVFPLDAPYYAIGSGFELALGAMAVGATAVEAVAAAIKHDIHSGGQVNSVSLKS